MDPDTLRELNSLLDEQKSYMEDIQSSMQKQLVTYDQIGNRFKKDITKDLNNQAKLQDKIANIQSRVNDLSAENQEALKNGSDIVASFSQQYADVVALQAAMLEKEQNKVKINETLKTSIQELIADLEKKKTLEAENASIMAASAEAAMEHAKKITGVFRKIPFVGDMVFESLGLSQVEKRLKETFKESIQKAMMDPQRALSALKDMASKTFSEIGGVMQKMFQNPMLIFIILIATAVKRFMELDKAGEDFRRTTGLTASQTQHISESVRNISRDYAKFGITAESAYKAAGALAAELDHAGFVTKDLIETTSLLAANLGVSEETSAKTIQNFMQLSNLSAEQASNLAGSTALLAKAGGVAPTKVMQDIANASETTLTMMRGNAVEMAKTAVEARRLGTDLNSVANSARQMLNFQESISAEMEASTLIGRNLNFMASRQAAFQGDILKSRQLALQQIKLAGDFTKMNTFQQEALAKAAGMTVGEVQKQLTREKQLNELKTKDRAAFNKYKALQEELANLNKDDIRTELQRMEMQSKQTQLMNSLKSIWVSISDVLVPIVQMLTGLIPIIKLIAFGVHAILSPFIALRNLISYLVKEFMELTAISKIVDVVSKFSDSISTASDNALNLATVVGGLFWIVVAGAKLAGASIIGIFKSIGGFILKPFKVIIGLFKSAIPDAVNESMKKVSSGVEKSSKNIGKSVEHVSKSAQKSASGFGRSIVTMTQHLRSASNHMANIARNAGRAILGFVSKIANAIGSIGRGIGKFIEGMLTGVANGMRAFASVPHSAILKGVLVIAAMGASLAILTIPLKMFGEIDWSSVFIGIGALTLLGTVAGVMGYFAPFILMGALAIGALGVALLPTAFAMKIMGESVSVFASSIDTMTSKIADIMTLTGAVYALSGSLMSLGAASMIASLALPVISIIGGSTSKSESVNETATSKKTETTPNESSKSVEELLKRNNELLTTLTTALKNGEVAVYLDKKKVSQALANKIN